MLPQYAGNIAPISLLNQILQVETFWIIFVFFIPTYITFYSNIKLCTVEISIPLYYIQEYKIDNKSADTKFLFFGS